jgi:tetratricopeptide (TPR) repeat protein
MKNTVKVIFCLLFLLNNNHLFSSDDKKGKDIYQKSGPHKHIVREAYKRLKLHLGYDIPELQKHIGNDENGISDFNPGGLVVIGAHREDAEDIVYKHNKLFGVYLTHFWRPDHGDSAKLYYLLKLWENAFEKATTYVNGNYSFSFESQSYSYANSLYYTALFNYYKTRSIKRNGVSVTHTPVQRDKVVWEIIGRICHLLADVTTPAHVKNDIHVALPSNAYSDTYENYMDAHHYYYTYQTAANYGSLVPIHITDPSYVNNSVKTLKNLFYTSAQIADHFNSDDFPGNDSWGINDNFSLYYTGKNSNGSIINLENKINSLPTVSYTQNNSGFYTVIYDSVARHCFNYSINATASLLYWCAEEMGIMPFVVPNQYSTIANAAQAAVSSGRTVKDVVVLYDPPTFNSGYTAPTDVNITFARGVIVILGNNGFVKTTGTGRIYDEGAEYTSNIKITQDGLCVGRYSNLTQALTNISSGQIIYIGSTYTENSSITIPAGVTVQVQSGATVNFNSGLTINGSLIANAGAKITVNSGLIISHNGRLETSGTSSSLVNINIPQSSGLQISGRLDSKYTNFNFGNGTECYITGTGKIYIDPYNYRQYSITIAGTTHTYNTYNTMFQGNGTKGSWNGVVLDYSGSNVNSLEYMHIRDAIVGIQIYETSPPFIKNNVMVNCIRGMEFLGRSLSTVSDNIFYANGGVEDIFIDTRSVPNLGTCGSPGNNSFKNNNPRVPSYQYPINSLNKSQLIYADGNYFQIPPFPPYPQCPNVIININCMVSDPAPYFRRSEEDNISSIEMTPFYKSSVVSSEKEKEPGYEEMNKSYMLYLDNKNEEAERSYREIISKYPNNACSELALLFLESITERKGKNEMDLLKEIIVSHKGTGISEFAEYRKVYQFIKLERYEEAAQKAKESSIDKRDIYFAPYKLYDLGNLYWHFMGKKEEGQFYFKELASKYSKHALANRVKTYINGYEKPSTPTDETTDEITVTETKLFANYPNPFNPSTVIKYQLSEASQVSLKVYDIMGREVSTLVNSFQNKGSYDVTFNANGFSSGIYFYKLNTNGKQLINKMLLMK